MPSRLAKTMPRTRIIEAPSETLMCVRVRYKRTVTPLNAIPTVLVSKSQLGFSA